MKRKQFTDTENIKINTMYEELIKRASMILNKNVIANEN